MWTELVPHAGKRYTDRRAASPCQAVAGAGAGAGTGVTATTALSWRAMRMRATPMRMERTARAIAIAATPKEATEVNNDARRKEAFMTVSRTGSSWSSWA